MLTQVMTNKFMNFDTLAKQCHVKSKEEEAMLSAFMKEFENRLQD